MRAPIRPLRGRWPALIERRTSRFFWADPQVLLRDDVTPDQFRESMSAINVGDTIKITGTNRHPNADALLLDNVDTTDAAIVDIGASDGSTSVDLIAKLGAFRSYTIADLYLTVTTASRFGQVLFYDGDGECILISGRRYAAWPSISRTVRLLFDPVMRAARHAERREVLLLNPSARALISSDPRISFRVHDVFRPWPQPAPDVIKVANLLRRLYFSDPQILTALHALHASLPDGGHLLIVDNPRIKDVGPRAGLYRRHAERFETIALTDSPPEIADLVTGVQVHEHGGFPDAARAGTRPVERDDPR